MAGIEAMLSMVYDRLDTGFDFLDKQTCVIWGFPGPAGGKGGRV